MLWAGERIVVSGGVAEGSLADCATTWDTSLLGRKVLAFHLGDREAGPLVFFTHIPRGMRTRDQPWWRGCVVEAFSRLPISGQHRVRTLLGKAEGHFHRSDTFRMVVSDGPGAWLCFNGRRVRRGHYRVQPANVPYSEWYGRTGCIPLTIDADRRGHPPLDGEVAQSKDAAAVMARVATAGPYLSELGKIHLYDDDAVSGVASTAARAAPGGTLSGSVDDDGWTELPNGSSAAAIAIGHPETGPMIVLSRNPPGAQEAPEGVYHTEMLRLVLKGSVSVGDRSYREGDWRLTDSDIRQAAVTHGPEGSTQLVFFADRRFLLPIEGDAPSGLEELQAALSREMHHAHSAPNRS